MRSIKVMLEPNRAYTRGLLEGVVAYGRLHGPWLFSFEAEFYRRPRQRRQLRAVDLRGFDGVIAQAITREELEVVAEAGVPAVVHGVSEPAECLATIRSDGQAIGSLAAEHLLLCGLTQFGYCGFGEFYWSREREEGFRRRLGEAGFEVSVLELQRSDTGRGNQRQIRKLREWLGGLGSPAGVMACNDDCALHVMSACGTAELRVPEAIAVVGADNDEYLCELCGYPLSSVALATKSAGFEAASVLADLMSGQEAGRREILVRPSYVVARRSTDMLAVQDEISARALRYIKDHAGRPVTVEEVAEAVAVSKRSLQLHTRQSLRRSVNALIQHERVGRAVRMLLETNLPISRIAEQLGFTNATAMGVSFKKVTGMTPLQYRREKQTVQG